MEMETFFKNASAAVSTAVSTAVSGAADTVYKEAVSMADDMHAIILADEKEVIKKREEEEAEDEEELPESATAPSTPTSKPVGFFRTISLTRKSSRKKQTSPYEEEEEVVVPEQQSSSNTEANEAQPSGSNKEKKETRSIFAKLKPRFGKKKIEPTRQSNFDEVMVETMKETIACEEEEQIEEQPTSSKIEVKGSPATLAKLMTKLDKTAKYVEKLQQELSKTKEEELQTRVAINALAAPR